MNSETLSVPMEKVAKLSHYCIEAIWLSVESS